VEERSFSIDCWYFDFDSIAFGKTFIELTKAESCDLYTYKNPALHCQEP
jgi:hypothetical protein